MEMHKDLPVLLFEEPQAFEKWLQDNYDKYSAVWIKFAKKNTRAVSISYEQALEIALCYGWIDGLINAYDEKYYLTRFSPRKPQSVWSKTNREAVEKLIQEGKMQKSGLATVVAAKANGRWDAAYDSSKTMRIPQDFLTELAKDKKAETFFKSLNRANTYAIAWRLQTAKKPEIRAKRMGKIMEMMKKGEKLH